MSRWISEAILSVIGASYCKQKGQESDLITANYFRAAQSFLFSIGMLDTYGSVYSIDELSVGPMDQYSTIQVTARCYRNY